MSSSLPGDGRLLRWFHRHAAESRLGPHFHQLESAVPYGSAALVYALLGLLAVRHREDRGVAGRAAVAGVVAWLVSNLLKLLVERPRPCVGYADYIRCGNHSFPEGPGMVLAAIAVAIWPRSRPIALVAAACAVADAVVQLGYGSHWPSDLIGAWVLGGLCGLIVPPVVVRLMRERAEEPAGE
jgi:membrane-associated phospholipid phosphatase